MKTPEEDGAVTAEAALVIPVLVMVAVSLCWLVSLGVTQLRVTDAARETVRALARGDDAAAAEALGRQVAPDGATFVVRRDNGTVRVSVRSAVRAPGGLFDFPLFDATATAVAAIEDGP